MASSTSVIPSFSETATSTLTNAGLGTPSNRFLAFSGAVLAAMYLLKPSIAFNEDGSQKKFAPMANKNDPATFFHPAAVAVLAGAIGAIFL